MHSKSPYSPHIFLVANLYLHFLSGSSHSNIIEETGRSKRRRVSTAPKPVEPQHLPSDFSGPESSDHSESDGEEYAMSDGGSE